MEAAPFAGIDNAGLQASMEAVIRDKNQALDLLEQARAAVLRGGLRREGGGCRGGVEGVGEDEKRARALLGRGT